MVDGWLHFPLDLHFSVVHRISRGETFYLEFELLMLLAFAIYGLYFYLLQRAELQNNQTFVLRLIWFTVIVGGCIYLFTSASLSDDVYGYASYGRLLSVHHANPYFVPPSAYSHDPTYALIHWKNAFAPYGPLWVVLSAGAGLISGPDRLGYLLVFRLFAFSAHLLNIWLVTATLRTMGRSTRIVTLGTLLYALNPLVLLESALGGHNDVFMLTFILLGLLLSARAERKNLATTRAHLTQPRHSRHYIPVLVAFTLAGLVKFTAFPILAFPVLKLCWDTYRARKEERPGQVQGSTLHHTATFRAKEEGCPGQPQVLDLAPLHTATLAPTLIRRWKFALLAGLLASLVCIGVALAAYAPFWLGHSVQQVVASFSSQPTENFTFNSLLAAINIWHGAHGLPAFLVFLNSRYTWNVITIVAVALSIVLGGFWLWRAPTTRTVAVVSLVTLTAILLVTPWFTSWYVTWLIGLAAGCLPVVNDRVGRSCIVMALTFSASAALSYYYVSVGHVFLMRYSDSSTWFVLVCVATFVMPVFAFFLSWMFRPSVNGPPQEPPQERGQASPLLDTVDL
jgi:hypothetical protein